jgi:hypothetical protein
MRWPRVKEIFEGPLSATIVFQGAEASVRKRWDALRDRIVEHVGVDLDRLAENVPSARLPTWF